ncbi:DUF2946 family protein [Pollutimonas bauzanensis]|uniref:DUF2946 family protein n=1 Tax=Pollutimonas bauzanensis TaxID=658167 RepID=UPI001FE6B563|nr:DUF2946 family protein [Pollutimonas bauzanensis]
MRNHNTPGARANYNSATMVDIGSRSKAINWRAHAVLCLLLFALALRSLIPIGYMPHTGALRDGRIEITFCTLAGDAAAVPPAFAGLFADHDEHHQNALSGTDCPFGILIHQALGAPAAPALAALPSAILSAPAFPFDNLGLPARDAQGSPLGPRAPPSLPG